MIDSLNLQKIQPFIYFEEIVKICNVQTQLIRKHEN